MASLLLHFARSVARHPDRIAIVNGNGRAISFAQLQARADSFAAYWHAQGVRQGDRVLMAMPLNSDLYASLAGLWALGATVVLPEPAMGLAGLRHAARTTNVTAYCASGIYCLLKYIVPELRPIKLLRLKPKKAAGLCLPELHDDDVALISFTSGTTGKPKAIPRSHGFLMAQHAAISPLLESPKPERDLVAFPVFTLINIASGQTSVLPNWKMSKLEKLAPDDLASWCNSQGVTRALLPPSLCEKLSQTKAPQKLHTIFTGGGPVFPNVLDDLQQRQKQLRVVCVYGSTEAEPIAHLDAAHIRRADKDAMLLGRGLLVGQPVQDIDIRIKGNEIQVAGDHVNKGYLDPADNVENKIPEGTKVWHRTGDAGEFDDSGRLWLWGRVGSEVVVGSKTLFPFSIEVAARQWVGVEKCALMPGKTASILVIQGDIRHQNVWSVKAQEFGVGRVQHLVKIPTDLRHKSKIDRAALRGILLQNSGRR